MVAGQLGVRVLDISDPTNVQLLSKVDTGVASHDCPSPRINFIPNSTIAIVTGGRGGSTLDYANPAKTVTVQKINTGVLSRFSGGRTSLVDSKTAITVGSGNAVCVLE